MAQAMAWEQMAGKALAQAPQRRGGDPLAAAHQAADPFHNDHSGASPMTVPTNRRPRRTSPLCSPCLVVVSDFFSRPGSS